MVKRQNVSLTEAVLRCGSVDVSLKGAGCVTAVAQ